MAAVPFSAEKAYREARGLADVNELDQALAKATAALKTAGNADNEWVWSLRVLQAELLTRKGDLSLVNSIRLPAKYASSEAAVRLLIAQGIANNRSELLKEALKLAEAKQPRLAFAAHMSIGMGRDEPHLLAALRVAERERNRLRVALATAALARFYTFNDRYAEAIEFGERALAELERLRAKGRIGSVAGNLGWSYQELGNWEHARDLFLKATQIAAAVGNVPETVKWGQQLGNVEFALRNYDAAMRYYTQALETAKRITSDEKPTLLTNLARTAVNTGRHDDARRFVGEALAIATGDQHQRARTVEARIDMFNRDFARAEKTLRDVAASKDADVQTRWTAQAYLAEVLERTGRKEAAETAYRSAINAVRDTRKNIKLELRLSFFNIAEEIFGRYVDFLMASKRVEDALAATELIRAETLEEGLRRGDAQRKLDARAIAKQRGATILCYFLGRDRSWVWTITPNAITHAPLPPDTYIERTVLAYARRMRDHRSSMKMSGTHAQELYRMLVAPAVSGLAKNARIIVVPDGELHALNFETLVVPGAQPHYWIDDVTLTYAASLQLLGAPRAKTNSSASMLLVGNPPVADPAYPALPFAKKELATIAAQFPQRVVIEGANATPAGYRAANPGRFDFVHFVAHGVSTRQQPLDSAVILGRDASKQYKLLARDILAQPLAARLVTISSCYGAGDRTFAGEGLVGLAWAFLGAGADEVIAALWEVNDSATPELMAKMYAGIRAGRDPAVALREAKLTLLKGRGVTTAPRYWAPFVLYSGG